MSTLSFSLQYVGHDADENIIDFYDVGQALVGFQRSLAITAHLVLNGEVITQAPSLKNAKIIALPPEEGSWKFKAVILLGLTGGYHVLTAPQDTVLGHLMFSAYDYVVSETMGFHVDFEKSLGKSYEELEQKKDNELPILRQSQLDSVIEKCEGAIREMHRPIVKSESAEKANIFLERNGAERRIGGILTPASYAYIAETYRSDKPEWLDGKVSSYNVNTFHGRIFTKQEGRPIPFLLSESTRSQRNLFKITQSLSYNAIQSKDGEGDVSFFAYKNFSKSGRLKGYFVIDVK
tara:strand:- start:246 stop:1121 length:876 start_codon:yes stop_codon:yes gene_type:complete